MAGIDDAGEKLPRYRPLYTLHWSLIALRALRDVTVGLYPQPQSSLLAHGASYGRSKGFLHSFQSVGMTTCDAVNYSSLPRCHSEQARLRARRRISPPAATLGKEGIYSRLSPPCKMSS